MRLPVLFTAVLFSHIPAALAEWHEASSEHFVIYADESERDLREFAERLERYHKAMSAIFPSKGLVPSPSNRPTIYVVRNVRQVRRLFGEGRDSAYIGGFYVPRAGGSVAFIPPVDTERGGVVSDSEFTMMHEYAHHYMFENIGYFAPRWFTEGFAEYFANSRFESNGDVTMGLANGRRAYEFTDASQITIEQLLDTQAYAARKKNGYDNFYSRSWLLFHYLYSNKAGRDKLVTYLSRLNEGEAELDAARAAFGDLDELHRELNKYARGRMPAFAIEAGQLAIGEIAIRELRPAEEAALPVRLRSDRGVNPEQAAEVVIEAREVAQEYPDEVEVLAALTEAEFDAGNDEAAIAVADRALALVPTHIGALVQKGYALHRIAMETKNADDWAAMRSHFVGINKIEPDHPVPLIYYYLSFVNQGLEPTANAVSGLEWALVLAPYDYELRMITARQQMNEKRYAQAVLTLSPAAYSAHQAEENPALQMLRAAQAVLDANANDAAAAETAPEEASAAQ